MSRELLKLAFEAIERGVKDGYWNKDTVDVSTRIQKYLAEQAAQPQQEPVAYIHRQGNHWEVSERFLCADEKARGWTEEPLYTSPQPSKPLTDEQIIKMRKELSPAHGQLFNSLQFARAIEAAHGIKEQP